MRAIVAYAPGRLPREEYKKGFEMMKKVEKSLKILFRAISAPVNEQLYGSPVSATGAATGNS